MWRFFWLLVILIFSVWLGLKIAEDPGYAVFAYRHWSVEMPLWFATIAFLVILFLLYGVLRFFDSIDFTLYRLKNWLRWRRKYKSYSKTNRGLVELIEGHWRSAEYYLLEGIAQSDAPLVNYLAAAKAAQEQKAYDRRDNYLRKAHDLAPQAQIAIDLTQTTLQLEQGNLEQALATLHQLRQKSPKNKLAVKLLEKVYVKLSDWPALLKLLPILRKMKIITEEQLAQFEVNLYLEILENAKHKKVDLAGIQQTWLSMPKHCQRNPELITRYIQLLSGHATAIPEIEKLIVSCLKKAWNSDLVELYGTLPSQDPKKQLAYAESWQKQYGNHAILSLTLGRLAMRCQLWGKARAYFEASLKLQPKSETYLEYGKLLEQLGEPNTAMKNYRDGLVLCNKE